uniref:hypothetical protein n=1 Tax=Escherichia coli TaxID=562 RepID=UPI001A7E13EB
KPYNNKFIFCKNKKNKNIKKKKNTKKKKKPQKKKKKKKKKKIKVFLATISRLNRHGFNRHLRVILNGLKRGAHER